MLITIIVFLVILTILVLIHELGHFLMARKFGIKVEEFGFGLPPRVFGIKKGETIYSINWLPIGGFVKLYGEDDAGGGKLEVRSKKLEVTEDVNRAFYARPVWQRATVVVAGVVMNFVLATVIISYVFTQGVPTQTGQVKVEEIAQDSPAALSDLRVGDIITAVDGQKVKEIGELRRIVQPKIEEQVDLIIARDGQVQYITLRTKKETVEGKTVGIIGVQLSDIAIKKYSIFEAPFVGLVESLKLSWLTVSGLVMMLWNWLIFGRVPEGVAGPVGVAQITGQAVAVGPMAVISFAGLLSLNLAVLNILPIPALDGGRFFFIVLEGITGKKVNRRFEQYAHTIGMAILLALIALITLRDIARLISGQPILPTP